jgi:hypothetical protein
MPDPYRRSIAELVTRYQFEPGLRDIYVEGDRDKFLVKWFFDRGDIDGVGVYPISISVDIPRELLDRYREYGNRGRVIVLCKELDQLLPVDSRSVRGLVDIDCAELLDSVPASRSLLCTEFSCIECYTLDERTLKKFSNLYLGINISWITFQEMFNVLAELFLLRSAKVVLANTAPWNGSFTRLCSIHGERIRFDRESFVERLVSASAGLLTRERLDGKTAELRALLSGDVRKQINGHDLIKMLSWFAHKCGVEMAIYQSTPLQRALVTSVEYIGLLETDLFRTLYEWAAN